MSGVSFVSPGGDPRLEAAAAREQEREVEIKAEAYARAREAGDGSQASAGPVRRALARAGSDTAP